MQRTLHNRIRLSPQVARALESNRPVVALETAVVTHGLPHPASMDALRSMQVEVESTGAVPAACFVDGEYLWIGAEADRIEDGACRADVEKASVRDLGRVLAQNKCAGLTVSATLFASQSVGIRVFATGGIGGAHLGAAQTGDISADLYQLSRSAVITVCSGAKSVLDIPRTLEHLETLGVPVLTFGAHEFPAFYLVTSGVATARVDTVQDIASIATEQWNIGQLWGLVVGNPIPAADAIAEGDWAKWLQHAVMDVENERIVGNDVTPYLLDNVAGSSDGKTVTANISLLRNNARLGAQIAVALAQ